MATRQLGKALGFAGGEQVAASGAGESKKSKSTSNKNNNNKSRDQDSSNHSNDNLNEEKGFLGDSSNIQLCDIIAQQREFQRRQESRTNLLALSGVNTSSSTVTSITNTTAASTISHQQDQDYQDFRPKTPRRKFSLSYAMSNLASTLGGSSGNVASSATNDQTPTKQRVALPPPPPPNPPARPARGIRHRASLITGGSAGVSVGPHPCSMDQAAGMASSSSDKKRGFVHKAIRRGSKMFDAMLLSSSQQQQQSDKNGSQPINRKQSSDSVGGRAGSRPASPEGAGETGGSILRPSVPFSTSSTMVNAVDQVDTLVTSGGGDKHAAPKGSHKPRLRLGSIPHDLRRALSLSNNFSNWQHSQNSHLNQTSGKQLQNDSINANKLWRAEVNSKQSSEPEVGNGSSADAARSNGDLAPVASNRSSRLFQANPTLESPASSSGVGGAGVRLRRKNSLFSPLSHAVHYYGSHYHSKKQANSNNNNNSNSNSNIEQQLLSNTFEIEQQQQQTKPLLNLQPSNVAPSAGAQQASSGQSASFTLCQDHSRTYKLIIFGSSAVGKTSLIQRFLYGQFPVAHKPTVEELHSNKYTIPELGEIYLEILDTSGTFEFPAMRRLSIEKGDAFILVFSISDQQSWEEVKHLRQLILEEKGVSAGTFLVGHNNDDYDHDHSSAAKISPDNNNKREDSSGGNRVSSISWKKQEDLSGKQTMVDNNNNNSSYATTTTTTTDTNRPASTPLSGDLEGVKRINSVYAAATKLTTGRRFSTVGGVSCGPTSQSSSPLSTSSASRANVAGSDFRLKDRRASQAAISRPATMQLIDLNTNDMILSGEPDSNRPFTHYNSQLSKVLRQRKESKRGSKRNHKSSHHLLQQTSMDDDLEDDHLRDSSSSSSNSSNENEDDLSPSGSSNHNEAGGKPSKPPATLRRLPGPRKPEVQAKSNTRRLKCRTPIVVVANKCDLDPSACEVDQEEAERLVREEWGNAFVSCSAKEALNIDRVFKELLGQARAPEILSQFVIDDHQQRRQSLPVLKNHLSAQHVKGLRNLYNQQQQQHHPQPPSSISPTTTMTAGGGLQKQPDIQRAAATASANSGEPDSQCRII